MACLDSFESLAGCLTEDLVLFPPENLRTGLEEIAGEEELLTAGFNEGVGEFRIEADRAVVRDGPGRRGPDDDVAAGRIGLGENSGYGGIVEAETDVDGVRVDVLVFDFGFSEGGMAVAAPVNGLLGADHVALFHEVGQLAACGGFEFGHHGKIGMLPVAEDAEALEFGLLDFYPLGGVLAADLADHMSGQSLLLALQFLFDLVLDGQAVAVPAGYIIGMVALHVPGLNDDVLQNLVEGVAHMDVAIGVGRAVMENIFTERGIRADHGFEGIDIVPVFEPLGLLLDEVCLHGKFCFWQIKGFLIVAHCNSWKIKCLPSD